MGKTISQKMRALHKHLLTFDKAFAFYGEALQGTNAFSEEALKVISLEAGHFFTLLPDTANLDSLYQFSYSILPEEPEQIGPVGSLPGVYRYSPIPSLKSEFADFLYGQIRVYAYQFMTDHYNVTYKERSDHEWFKLYGAHYLEEVYYFLSQQEATTDLIERCLSYSETFWHSLCMLSNNYILDKAKKTLQLSDIQKFCKSAQFILVTAYDGEGYVVWQKNST